MKYIFLTSLAIISVVTAFSQSRFTVHSTDNGQEALVQQGIYRFSEFKPGIVTFSDGTRSKSKLNFNLLLGEMMFLDEKGDTLAIADKESIKLVTIGPDTLYYSEGFLELMEGKSFPRLVVANSIKIADKRTTGAYGIPNSTTRTEAYKSFNNGRPNDKVIVDESTVFAKVSEYYLMDNKGQFYPLTIKSVTKFFPGKEKEIISYQKENKLNLKRYDDIKVLLAYIEKTKS